MTRLEVVIKALEGQEEIAHLQAINHNLTFDQQHNTSQTLQMLRHHPPTLHPPTQNSQTTSPRVRRSALGRIALC